MGELYLCATPLGNLGDITLRALEVLRQVDLIAAEDTRHTRKLLNHFGIHTPITSYYEHNRQAKAPLLLADLAGGKKIALVSDAGTPGIADPGHQLVLQAIAEGHQVTAIPGPSAVITALVVSGIRPHPFYFQGFLPRKTGERRALLTELAEETRTGVFYEAPHRLQKTLQDFCEILGAGATGGRCPGVDQAVRGGLPGQLCPGDSPFCDYASPGRVDHRDCRTGRSGCPLQRARRQEG